MGQAFFITGTDTGVGKTLIATALLQRAHDQGKTTLGLKPVAAGCTQLHGEWVNDDAQQLLAASSGGVASARCRTQARAAETRRRRVIPPMLAVPWWATSLFARAKSCQSVIIPRGKRGHS